jgi:hypothetical protein
MNTRTTQTLRWSRCIYTDEDSRVMDDYDTPVHPALADFVRTFIETRDSVELVIEYEVQWTLIPGDAVTPDYTEMESLPRGAYLILPNKSKAWMTERTMWAVWGHYQERIEREQ